MERVKYYSKNDLGNGLQLLQTEKVLDRYQEGQSNSNINDVLELYNVKLFLDNGLSLCSWTEEQITNYKQKTKGFGRDIVGFFREQDNIEGLLNDVDFAYYQDFWDIIESFGLLDLLSDKILESILKIESEQIEYILHCKEIVRKYDDTLCTFLLSYPKAINLLLHTYLIIDTDFDKRKLYLPKSLSIEQKRQIVEDYLKSGKATLNVVQLIMQAKDVDGFSLTPKIKLLAKKLEPQLNVVPEDAIVAFCQTGYSIQFSKEKGIPHKKAWLDGLIFNYVYSEEYLDSLDEDQLLYVFVSCFEYLDSCGLLKLCYNWHEGDILEKVCTKEVKGFYPINNFFRMKNNIAVSQLAMFDAYLRGRGKSLEVIIKSYYENHFKNAYGFPSMSLNLAKDEEDFVNKNKVIAPEMESVVKQFNLFVEEGEIDPELFQMSMPLPITLSKSLLWGRHKYVVWGDKCQEAFTPMKLLFSDQSLLSFVEPFKDKRYHTLFELLTHELCVEYDKYENHQRPKIDYLISQGYLIIDNGLVKLSSSPRIEILGYMYKKTEMVYYCHTPQVRAEIDVMVKEGILSYDDYLLSPQERHYINFFLNASEYSNGMQLRNKYSHGAMSCLDSEEEHKNAYYYFLMIFVIILLKMNDDMNLALRLNEAIKRGKELV